MIKKIKDYRKLRMKNIGKEMPDADTSNILHR